MGNPARPLNQRPLDQRLLDQVEINPDDLEPTIGIDLGTQKKILRLCARLERISPEELLGVEPTSNKKDIRRAYFARMAEFHADKFFGKELGEFGPRLTKITDRLTSAHDQLSRQARKRSKLPPDGKKDDVTSRPTSSMPVADECASGMRLKAAPVFEPAPSAPEPQLPPPRQKKARTASRRSLAKRLGSRAMASTAAKSTRTAEAPSPPRAPSAPAGLNPAVASELKARYMSRRHPEQWVAEKHRVQAEQHLSNAEWKAAVTAIGVAIQHAPDDPRLLQRRGEIEVIAFRALAPEFEVQAERARKKGHLEAAATALERAARGTQSAALYAKAASWLLEAPHLNQESQRFLIQLAKRAVELRKNDVDCRLILARAYEFVGMRASAVGEARRVLQMNPDCSLARQLVSHV